MTYSPLVQVIVDEEEQAADGDALGF